MKKYILLTALILAMIPSNGYSQEVFSKPEDLENFEQFFYEAPVTPLPEVVENKEYTIKGMPLVKKTRIKITNFFRERDYNKYLKEKQKLEAPDNNEVEVKHQIDETPSEKTLELEGTVKTEAAQNDVMLDADNIDYDEKTSDVTATGSPVLKFPPQGVTLKADKIIYNQVSNILKAYGSVELIKDGNSIFGDYMQINLNEESALLDNVNTKQGFMTVTARKSEIKDGKIILHNGKFESKDSHPMNFRTKMVAGNFFNNMLVDDEDKVFLSDEIGDTSVKVKADEIFVNAKRDHDTVTLKKASIDYGKHHLFTMPSVTLHTNKNHEYFEGNYPELGSMSRLGMFIGPGFTIDTPLQNGSTVKLIPMLNNKGGFGIGGIMKYRSATNYTHFAYGSAADLFILKGRQYLDDKLMLQYGMNSYMDEWFFGGRMAKLSGEILYKDQSIIPSTIGKDLDLSFKHRIGFGFMQDNDVNKNGEQIALSDMSTTRTRYMAEIAQNLYKYQGKGDLKTAELAFVMQGSVALYGTGDTQFVGRMGPRLRTQYKYWLQDLTFFASAFHDHTPMKAYDMYRYGHANVLLREAFKINKFLTVAWSGSMTLTGDSPNDKIFQENSFILVLGPDDFKFNLGYDWVRKQTYFTFIVSMDTKGSGIEFDRMEIKNPDRLSKNNQAPVELKVFDYDGETKEVTPKKMMYAEVIDIEDPSREEL